MKCKNCASDLIYEGGVLKCAYCGASFPKEELLPPSLSKGEFVISGGVLTSYLGANPEIVIPDGVISIGSRAFFGNAAINAVALSSTVNRIEDNAFEGCVNLKKLTGYENVTHFGNGAFVGSGLQEITIGNSVSFIGRQCFALMPDLKRVVYKPKKPIRLERAFSNCKSLAAVEMDERYFFPSFRAFREVRNNPGNQRPTFADAFLGTPYFTKMRERLIAIYKKGVCPECGGKIKKGLFHARCADCKIDFKN